MEPSECFTLLFVILSTAFGAFEKQTTTRKPKWIQMILFPIISFSFPLFHQMSLSSSSLVGFVLSPCLLPHRTNKNQVNRNYPLRQVIAMFYEHTHITFKTWSELRYITELTKFYTHIQSERERDQIHTLAARVVTFGRWKVTQEQV